MLEQWKPIEEFKGQLLVSDKGRVLSTLGNILKVKDNGILLYKSTQVNIVKAVASAFIPNPNEYAYVKTKDGEYDDLSVDNIEWTNIQPADHSNRKPVTLIKDGKTIQFNTTLAAADYLGCNAKHLRSSLREYSKIHTVHGYIVCYTEHKERLEAILNGTFGKVQDLEGEEWRPIEGAHNYMVSNKARVKRTGLNERLIVTTENKDTHYRYAMVVKDDHKAKNFRLHRLVAMAFIPNPDNLPEIDHLDGDIGNNEVSNLEWVTRQENVKREWDAIMKRRRND